jgi:hypothetical protein
MANPRTAVELDGIGAVYATFKADATTIPYAAAEAGGSVAVGKAVKMHSADDTVALTTDASDVVGKIITVEADGKVNVQVAGFMKLPSGAGATLTRGVKIVGDLDTAAPGFVRAAASAAAAELLVARGFIVRNADAANVVVHL